MLQKVREKIVKKITGKGFKSIERLNLKKSKKEKYLVAKNNKIYYYFVVLLLFGLGMGISIGFLIDVPSKISFWKITITKFNIIMALVIWGLLSYIYYFHIKPFNNKKKKEFNEKYNEFIEEDINERAIIKDKIVNNNFKSSMFIYLNVFLLFVFTMFFLLFQYSLIAIGYIDTVVFESLILDLAFHIIIIIIIGMVLSDIINEVKSKKKNREEAIEKIKSDK